MGPFANTTGHLSEHRNAGFRKTKFSIVLFVNYYDTSLRSRNCTNFAILVELFGSRLADVLLSVGSSWNYVAIFGLVTHMIFIRTKISKHTNKTQMHGCLDDGRTFVLLESLS